MATSDILPFGSNGTGSSNVLSQSSYVAFLASLSGNAYNDGDIPDAAQFNKIMRQSSFVAASLTQAMVNAGISVVDDGNLTTLAASMGRVFTPVIIGASANLVMSVQTASASGTLQADEIIVGDVVGGQTFKMTAFSNTCNLATTGANGMDIGTAPASGFVALYAIYNPTTGDKALLATNVTSIIATMLYSGANMPSGYTMSALVSVWRMTSGSLFDVGIQYGKEITMATQTALSSSVQKSTPTALSIATIVPLNTKYVRGNTNIQSTGGSYTNTLVMYSSAAGIGSVGNSFFGSSGNGQYISFYNLPISTAQTIYYTAVVAGGTMLAGINITGYSI